MTQPITPVRDRRDELVEFAQTALSLRWLALAALIAQEAITPTPTRTPLALYGGMLAYTLAFTLYGWRYPERAGQAARWALPFDSLAAAAGMLWGAHPRSFLFLAYVVAALGGVFAGYGGASAIAALVALVQFPSFSASLFRPDEYVGWGIATLSLAAIGNGTTAVAARVDARLRQIRLLTELSQIASHTSDIPATASGALEAVVKYFGADSGSLMLYDPQAGRLEIVAAHRLSEAYQQAGPRIGEGIAGWVAQEGRPMLLTPRATIPFRLSRAEIGSSICLPLATGGQPLGVMNLNRSTRKPWFTSRDLEAADIVAQQLAGPFVLAQRERILPATVSSLAATFSEVSQALARDPAVLWPALLDQARSLVSGRFAVLALEREDTGTIDIVATRGVAGAVARAYLPTLLAASTDGTVHITASREDGESAVACVPLRVFSQTVGAIGIGLPRGTAPSASLLTAVAAHVAAAVHTARTAYRIADIGIVEERRRIAREMHDGLAQTLADALLQTDLSAMATQKDPSQISDDLRELRTLLERAMRELREFMSELRRESATDSKLLTALETLGREFERRHETHTEVVATGDDTHLPSAMHHAVLAIVRQALTNVRTHARATAVTIRAQLTESDCTVTVADNGVGFDLAAFRARQAEHHLGLASMEERATLVGGRLDIETTVGRGTTITVRIPLGRNHGQDRTDTRAAG